MSQQSQFWLWVAVAFFAGICIVGVWADSRDCEARGGVLVRGLGSYQCVQPQR